MDTVKPLTEDPTKRKPNRKRKYVKRKTTAKTKAARAAHMKLIRRSQEKNMTVSLKMQHFVNGQVYGPGTITVKQGLGQQFLNAEAKQVEQERQLFGTKAVIIGSMPNGAGAHTTREVAPETFDYSLGNEKAF